MAEFTFEEILLLNAIMKSKKVLGNYSEVFYQMSFWIY